MLIHESFQIILVFGLKWMGAKNTQFYIGVLVYLMKLDCVDRKNT